jgi:hypothetical protein
MAREVLGPAAAARRLLFTPLFGDDHLQVKALAALQVPPKKKKSALQNEKSPNEAPYERRER